MGLGCPVKQSADRTQSDLFISLQNYKIDSRMNVGVPPVVLKSARKHTATLIFLHGLGDTGMGWAGALNTIRPDYLKVRHGGQHSP